MKRLSCFILSTHIFILTTSSASFAQTSWQQVMDNEAGFSISFPGQPTYQTSTNPNTAMQSEVYKFFYTGRLLRITFAPLPEPVRTPAELSKVYGELSQEVVPSGGILLRQQKLPDGGRQYDTVAKDSVGTIYGRTRFYIRNSMYYAVAFEMYSQDGLNEHEAERFLSSFHFLSVSPKGKATKREGLLGATVSGKSRIAKWYPFRSPDGNFTVEFPGKPTYQLDSSPESVDSFHRYHYFYGENIFQVSYREFPEAGTQPEQVLRRAIEIYTAPTAGRRILRQERLPDGAYLIVSQGVTNAVPFYSQTRLYVRSSRVYYVTTLTQDLAGPNNNDLVRFFASFHLL